MDRISPSCEILMLVAFLGLVMGCSILYGKINGKFGGTWDKAIAILFTLLVVGITTFSIATWVIIVYGTSV